MNKKEFSVTVVIPTFNEEKYISDCLDALFDQTQKITRTIVVDNNSTDNTKKIVSSYEHVELLEEKRQGQTFARFQGFLAADSEFIATVDADTIVEPEWLSEMVFGLNNQQADAISSYTIARDVNLGPKAALLTSAALFFVSKLFSGHYGLYGSTLLMKNSVWRSIKGQLHLDQSVWEDVDLAAALNKNGHKIGLVKKPLVTTSFRRSESSAREMYRYLHGWYKAFRYYNRVTAALIWVLVVALTAGAFVSKMLMGTQEGFKKIGSSVAGAVVR